MVSLRRLLRSLCGDTATGSVGARLGRRLSLTADHVRKTPVSRVEVLFEWVGKSKQAEAAELQGRKMNITFSLQNLWIYPPPPTMHGSITHTQPKCCSPQLSGPKMTDYMHSPKIGTRVLQTFNIPLQTPWNIRSASLSRVLARGSAYPQPVPSIQTRPV